MKARITVLLFLILLLAALSPGFPACTTAQQSAIADGVAWLEVSQDVSGLWGTDKKTPFRDATVVLEVLCPLDADSAAIDSGLNAVQCSVTTSADYLARKILAAASCSDGGVPAGFADSLAAMQKGDGGWGYGKGYGSNVLETALALKALKGASYSNMTKLGAGVSYLTSQQNADSGWTFVTADSSQVFYTTHAVITLAALQGDFSVAPNIHGGVELLKAQAHGDGGFGTGGVSNPYETGLALAAIIKGDPTASEITDAWTYLETSQLPNGSWNDDAYSTAMAIYGLMHIAPDLAVGTSDIVLSNPMPSDSEIVVISATIHNQGVLDADSVLTQVFDGHPDLAGTQIGSDVTIFSLAPGGDSTIQVDWNTYPLAGDHDIYVLVDPLNEIREPEKLNNTAKKSVHVYFPPDLVIDSIVFEPPYPDSTDSVTIWTFIGNAGELAAANVRFQVWDGDPEAGGIELIDYTITSIPAHSYFLFGLNTEDYFNVSGSYPIYACADSGNAIREISEFNNCRCETLWVGQTCLAMSSNVGLNLLGLSLQPLDPITSYSMIPQIPHCNEIDGWDRVTQMWISAVEIAEGVIIGDEFPIELRDGFFTRAIAPGDTDFCGMRVQVHECTHFEAGLNMTSVPNGDACYTAYSLIDDINTCDEAHSWDVALQAWVSAVKIAEGVFIGEDFPVTPGNGYFVKVYDAGDWCTRTCDTITNLPDLYVRPVDIWLDPNPVPVGDSVILAVNINNIGNDTAFTPRLDIYEGDPDAGGTPIAGGNLPVDILPGEASGYYWIKHVFEAADFIDIYGIADYYDAIPELDEDNNQAYQTLQVTASALTADTRSTSDEQSLASATVSPSRGADKSLRLIDELVPVPVLMSTAPSVSKKEPTTRPVAKTSSSAVATSIDNVIIGNHSSASVTIAWVTDGLADGCINYGITPALGSGNCEEGPDGEVHLVVLDNLSENTAYYSEIVSGGITDDNEGDYYSFTTTTAGAGVPASIYGRVNKAGTDLPVGNTIVSCKLRRGEIDSHPLITLTNPDGMWSLNLGNLKNPASNNVLPYEAGDTIFLQLHGGSNGTGADTVVISGTSPQDCGVQEVGASTDVLGQAGLTGELVPDRYYLSANYPNPFNLSTMIKFGLPVAGRVDLSIYNVVGQKVVTLLDEDYEAGHHLVSWNGLNTKGQPVSSGIYFFRIKSEEFVDIRKMLLLK